MSIKITGLDELQKKLSNLSSKAKALDGKHSVRLDELLSPTFMREHTPFGTIDEMFAKSGFKAATPDDFQAIPDAEWDKFIASQTKFKNWDEMKQQAGAEWAKKRLGL